MTTAAHWHRWTPEPASTAVDVPPAVADEQIERAVALLSGRRLAVLTGAGV